MMFSRSGMATACIISLASFGNAFGHGLVEDPPSRNWFCGYETKPDEVLFGNPVNPVCGDAFTTQEFFNGGYNFMSVLTHTEGRKVVDPLPENVCGFNAETFNDGPTPWDEPIDWPTTPMSAGPQKFTWNITWGSHFSDTEDFRYYITKPGFEYQVGTPLSWDDFEESPFCELFYDDSNPDGNPSVVPLKGTAQFETFCEVPERAGRHVIYAEWGRNEFTFERFHGCVDVEFDGSVVPVVEGPELPETPITPPTMVVESDINSPFIDNQFTGAGTVLLDGSGSQGDLLSYTWTVNASDRNSYSLESSDSDTTNLLISNPPASQDVMVTLRVTDQNGNTDSETITFRHDPDFVVAPIVDLGPLTETPQDFAAGDAVQIRLVSSTGEDAYLPEEPIILTNDNSSADQWPSVLGDAVNALNTYVRIGLLNEAGDTIEISPCADCKRIYIVDGPEISGGFLVHKGAGTEPTVDPEAESGFVFSRTDVDELRWITTDPNGELGSIWISESCAAQMGGATSFGDWFELLDLAPGFDTVENPCPVAEEPTIEEPPVENPQNSHPILCFHALM